MANTEEIVHVIPLGWEYDRAILPFSRFTAHRVYVLCDPTGHPRREYYLAKVLKYLRARRIDVSVVRVDTFMDLPGTMREVSRILQTELDEGARVYVNVSTSGKLAAIGVALAAMAHLSPERGGLYYVPALDYPASEVAQKRYGMSRGMKGDPLNLPLFELTLPNAASRIVLSALVESSTKQLAYSAARRLLFSSGFDGFGSLTESKHSRTQRNRWNVNLYRRVVQPLLRQRLVEVESSGRDKALRLTRAGEYVACLCLTTPEATALRSTRS